MRTFDREFARLLLEICRYTYAAGFGDQKNANDKQDALKWIQQVGGLLTNEPIILHGSETSVACIASYSDRNIVAYMGTKTQFNTRDNALASLKDWSKNLRARPKPFALSSAHLGDGHPQNIDKDNLGGLVHRGFLIELAAVQDKVVTELLKNGGRNRPVYITGHSQGGAEAALATRALLAGGFSVASTYTFAAPRPGNQAFADSIPDTVPVHRIEFGNDIVPHVPPIILNQKTQKLIDRLKSSPLLPLPDIVNAFLALSQQANTQNGFVGVGTLCYGNPETRTLQIDISADQEKVLFDERLDNLFELDHLKDWIEHHHLSGTTEETKGPHPRKGNYTALVSEFL